jgi:hypothetical protein
MESMKHQPPKFSYAMKDLTEFLGIFEVSEEELKRKRGNVSETSSHISEMSKTGF